MSAHCEHPVELISALLDGELTPAERADAERRLAECASCRALYADLSAMAAAHHDLAAAPPVPERLRARIRRALAEPSARAPRRAATRWWLRPAPLAAAASVVAAAVLGVLVLRGQLKPAPVTETTAASPAARELPAERQDRPVAVAEQKVEPPPKSSAEALRELAQEATPAKGAPVGGVVLPAPPPELERLADPASPPADDAVAERERGARESAFAAAPPAPPPSPPAAAGQSGAAAKQASVERSERIQDTWTEDGVKQDGRVLRKSEAAAAAAEADAKMLRDIDRPAPLRQLPPRVPTYAWPVFDRMRSESVLRAEVARRGGVVHEIAGAPDLLMITAPTAKTSGLAAWLATRGVQGVPDELKAEPRAPTIALAVQFVPQTPTP